MEQNCHLLPGGHQLPAMKFISNVTGLPLPTPKAMRWGAYSILLTARGFVVGDPEAFGLPGLLEEAALLPGGSGFTNGRLHLRSRNFPMYYPDSSPRLLLVSQQLTVMPFQAIPEGMREGFLKLVPCPAGFGNPDPELLRNVLPCFEIYQDARKLVSA